MTVLCRHPVCCVQILLDIRLSDASAGVHVGTAAIDVVIGAAAIGAVIDAAAGVTVSGITGSVVGAAMIAGKIGNNVVSTVDDVINNILRVIHNACSIVADTAGD